MTHKQLISSSSHAFRLQQLDCQWYQMRKDKRNHFLCNHKLSSELFLMNALEAVRELWRTCCNQICFMTSYISNFSLGLKDGSGMTSYCPSRVWLIWYFSENFNATSKCFNMIELLHQKFDVIIIRGIAYWHTKRKHYPCIQNFSTFDVCNISGDTIIRYFNFSSHQGQ